MGNAASREQSQGGSLWTKALRQARRPPRRLPPRSRQRAQLAVEHLDHEVLLRREIALDDLLAEMGTAGHAAGTTSALLARGRAR
jgi:hypothetical protein